MDTAGGAKIAFRHSFLPGWQPYPPGNLFNRTENENAPIFFFLRGSAGKRRNMVCDDGEQ